MRVFPRFALLFTISLGVLGVLTLVAMLLAPAAAVAGDAAPEAPSAWEVLVPGLASPRDLIFGPDGALYVAVAGRGGPASGLCTGGGGGGTVCLGENGKVIRVEFDGSGSVISVTDVISGLPSVAVPDADPMANADAVGVHDIAFDESGQMYITLGLGGSAVSRTEIFSGTSGEMLGHLAGVGANGQITPLVDIAAHEDANNPAGGPIDSNPWFMVYDQGVFHVVDAGGNSLLNVYTATGTVSTVATFPNRMVPFMTGTIPMEPVPTGIALGDNGDTFVGELTGFPFPPGGANVYRVEASGTTTYAGGFTNITDIAFDADGNLYVLEFSSVGLLNGVVGALTRVTPDGRRLTMADDLLAPTGVTVGPDGYIYVSNVGASNAGGQVIRLAPPVDVYLPITTKMP